MDAIFPAERRAAKEMVQLYQEATRPIGWVMENLASSMEYGGTVPVVVRLMFFLCCEPGYLLYPFVMVFRCWIELFQKITFAKPREVRPRMSWETDLQLRSREGSCWSEPLLKNVHESKPKNWLRLLGLMTSVGGLGYWAHSKLSSQSAKTASFFSFQRWKKHLKIHKSSINEQI